MHVKTSRGRLLGALVLAVVAGGFAGCNDRPIDKLDNVVTAVNRQENELPAKTKLDFLFVIDNSGSMCEEQDNLTRNFQAFADFLFEELNAAADYRIAVVSTDMNNPEERGRFLNTPALVASANCTLATPPQTQDCPPPDQIDPVIKAEDVGRNCDENLDPAAYRECVKQDLLREFRCHATLGTNGYGFEKGLEAMRLGLSCGGPNAGMFEQCCVNGAYNPACVIPDGTRQPCAGGEACPAGETCQLGLCRPPEPDFLRPDAILAVIVISDEDDCSDPATNPAASRRVVCRPSGTADSDADGLPDGFGDTELCPDREPTPAEAQACSGVCGAGAACDRCLRNQIERTCFQRECGLPPCGPGQDPAGGTCRTADDCRAGRCRIDESANSNCEWFRSNLTPVSDYYRFLFGLKARPNEQLLVATVVGLRAYTQDGDLITYNQPERQEQLLCLDQARNYDPFKDCNADSDCPGVGNTCVNGSCSGDGAEAFCCPNGACVGNIQTSCESENNGAAFAGRRYLELSELFGGNGIGCPPGEEDGGDCVHICVEDFAAPLEAIRGKVAELLGSYCLDKPPACQVPTENGPRPCETSDEFDNPDNYLVEVKIQCLRTEAQGGKCQEVVNPQILDRSAWSLELGVAGCPGGALLQLQNPPAAGSEVFVEFVVDVAGERANAQPVIDAGIVDEIDAAVGQ
ncbi:MAG: hypothetical protein KC613_01145 [Myxococcales bacterium]|nr:hypothetical protein [Myxococcales bacterium]